jgi:hypothetical protein
MSFVIKLQFFLYSNLTILQGQEISYNYLLNYLQYSASRDLKDRRIQYYICESHIL